MGEMHDQSDAQLLRAYAERGAEAAFAEIVARHTDLVYSAALRQVCSPDLARDVTQSVFTDLARKAREVSFKLSPEASLVGWLYRGTRFAARDLYRNETRRTQRERQAMEQLHPAPETPPDWEHLRHVLDDAMSELDDSDRDAVLLRYFKNHDLRTVGAALGISDDAAQKRVSRAVERLREFFAKRGVTVGASGLAVVISTNAVQAAPVGLALTISTAAALAGTTIATTATITATKAIAMTTLQKTIVTATIAVLAGVGIYEARQASQLRDQVQNLQQQQAPMAEQIQQLQAERDDSTNQIATLRTDIERLSRNTSELLRLRNQLSTLRREITPRGSVNAVEPIYENRNLSQWLADLDIPRATNGIYEQDPKYAKAAAAIRAMGSETFPYLLKLLSGGGGDTQMRQAVRAFEVLGSQANALIPQFESIFEKSPGYSLHAFAAIGKDSTPILIKSLTHDNAWVQNNAAAALTQNLYDQKITPQEAASALTLASHTLTSPSTANPN